MSAGTNNYDIATIARATETAPFGASVTVTDADLYVASRATEADAFGSPTLITEPGIGISTADREENPFVSADGCELLFLSNRTSGQGANGQPPVATGDFGRLESTPHRYPKHLTSELFPYIKLVGWCRELSA